MKNISVLIVDDIPAMTVLVRNILKELKIRHIDHALSGPQAIDKLKDYTYDLIIADLTMEPMSGLNILSWVRSIKKYDNTKFLMMCSDISEEQINEFKTYHGKNNVIKKPFSVKSLDQKIKQIL